MTRKSRAIVAATALAASSATGVWGAEERYYDGWLAEQNWKTYKRLTLSSGAVDIAASCSAPSAAPVDRQIELRPGTRYVNVTAGETVRFKVGTKLFVCKFDDTLRHSNFDFSKIAPRGIDVKGVRVYCQPTLYERAG